MKLFITATLLIFSFNCAAIEVGPYKIAGEVKSFTSEFVTIDTNDAIVEIPRGLVKQPIVTGKILKLILLPEQKQTLKIKPKKH